jgi:hypothetical protein
MIGADLPATASRDFRGAKPSISVEVVAGAEALG